MNNDRGFTLIEIMAVLVILGVIASVFAFKYYNADVEESTIATKVVPELNSREMMTWSNLKLQLNYTDDKTLFEVLDLELSNGQWTSGPAPTGGTYTYGSATVRLVRTPSTKDGCAQWRAHGSD